MYIVVGLNFICGNAVAMGSAEAERRTLLGVQGRASGQWVKNANPSPAGLKMKAFQLFGCPMKHTNFHLFKEFHSCYKSCCKKLYFCGTLCGILTAAIRLCSVDAIGIAIGNLTVL